MATLIRIKRPLASEPAENIVVKLKRRKLEGASERGEEDNVQPTGVLQRVATVASKDGSLQPEVLQEIHSQHLTHKELQSQYKRPSAKDPGYRDAMKQLVQATATHSRLKIHAQRRGNLEGVNIGSEESSEIHGKEKCRDAKTSKGGDRSGKDDKSGEESVKVDKTCTMEQEDIKYCDVELPWTTDKDIITCNGVPLKKEKYVYDIYHCPTPIDWTEFVCEVERYEYPAYSDGEEMPDDEDDENDEGNWRNDYPDEEEGTTYEDEEGYMYHMLGWREKRYDTDESSYDADEYSESNDFDEDGNLLQYGDTLHSFRRHLACMAVADDDDEETARESRSSKSEFDGGDEIQ